MKSKSIFKSFIDLITNSNQAQPKILEIAEGLKQKTGIEIPNQIVDLFLNYEEELKDSFLLESLIFEYDRIKERNEAHTNILISEVFAQEIMKLISLTINDHGIEKVFTMICNHEFNGIKNVEIKNNKLFDTRENKYRNESLEIFIYNQIFFATRDFDIKHNQFNFSIIQNAYENLSSDEKLIKCIWILDADCGGEGGMIVKGANTGNRIDYYYGAFDRHIPFQDETIEYEGFPEPKWEKSYVKLLTAHGNIG